MFRSTIRRIRRTLSFRSKKKKQGDGSTSGAAGGGSNQNWENDANNIKNGGCTFEVKYLGSIEVSESRGTQVCSQAAHQMKMSSAGKKKQRVTLSVTEETLRVTDDETKIMVVDQVIEKVSFCTPDPHDEKLFSYICRDGTSRRWLCHSFKGIKDSGERISHAVGCAFAACLAKKQAQNQQNQQALQRGTQARKTLEARPNGVKLPQQSVDALKKLNQDDYDQRVEHAMSSQEPELATVASVVNHAHTDGPPAATPTSAPAASPPQKGPNSAFARPRPSAGTDSGFSRHTSLPYRTKKSTSGKSSGSATYQALTEDPLPPRIYNEPLFPSNDFVSTPAPAPAAEVPVSQADLWLNTTANNQSNNVMNTSANFSMAAQPNPFSTQQQQPMMMTQLQPMFTQQPIGMHQQQQQQLNINPFAGTQNTNGGTTINPFNEKFV